MGSNGEAGSADLHFFKVKCEPTKGSAENEQKKLFFKTFNKIIRAKQKTMCVSGYRPSLSLGHRP